MRKILVLISLIIITIWGCSTTITRVGGEGGARARIEQRALSAAMEQAFKDVNFKLIANKRVYVETQSLSKGDINFITAYINSLVIENGGIPIASENEADVKILNITKVSGSDEISRKILSDKVTAEYKSTMSFIDMKDKRLIRSYQLSAEAEEIR